MNGSLGSAEIETSALPLDLSIQTRHGGNWWPMAGDTKEHTACMQYSRQCNLVSLVHCDRLSVHLTHLLRIHDPPTLLWHTLISVPLSSPSRLVPAYAGILTLSVLVHSLIQTRTSTPSPIVHLPLAHLAPIPLCIRHCSRWRWGYARISPARRSIRIKEMFWIFRQECSFISLGQATEGECLK